MASTSLCVTTRATTTTRVMVADRSTPAARAATCVSGTDDAVSINIDYSSSSFGFSHQGSPQLIIRRQLFLSSVFSSVTSTSAVSSFTTSINLFLAFHVSSFLATPSFSQYTHHVSSVRVYTNSVLPLVFSPQTVPPVLSL